MAECEDAVTALTQRVILCFLLRMPELAEVEFYRKQWMQGRGWRFRCIHVNPEARVYRDSDAIALARAVAGLPLTVGRAHGKQMLFGFGSDFWLRVHLGMAGRLESAEPWHQPVKHEHLVLAGAEGSLIFSDYRMFGRLSFERAPRLPGWWRRLPPEPGSARFSPRRLREAFQRHARAPIKAVLLNQAFFPGLGNWMVDEILWRARVHPGCAAGRVDAARQEAVFDAIQFVAREALATIGVDWSDPPADWLFRHRWRDGGLCPRTGVPLRRETIGGRTTCFSPAWQNWPEDPESL